MQDDNNAVNTPTFRNGTLKTKSDSILQNFIVSLICKAALGFTLISQDQVVRSLVKMGVKDRPE